jgi:hypothetical protein
MDDKRTATQIGVRDAWDFYLSQHNVSVPETIEIAMREAMTEWLNAHSQEIIDTIADRAAGAAGSK